MRTKHLFSAVTIAALFAACSNEELVAPSAPSFVKDGRPTVENVKLAFQKAGETNTRIGFDPSTGDYYWEDGDKIGALLMDEITTGQTLRPHSNPAAWGKLSWLEKYSLKNYIHTNYPFTYNKTNDTWTSAATMLEGNYFFASPYEGYNSERQLIHSIGAQTQLDGTVEAAAAAYAKNQYWIGYSQIKAGAKTGEALTTVEMTRVLAPIRFAIKSVATQTRHVNKITIEGEDVRTRLTIDPTCKNSQGYTGENGQGDYNLIGSSDFNYANYISQLKGGMYAAAMKEEVYQNKYPVTAQDNQVYNIDAVSNYDRFNALRAIVDVESVKEPGAVQYAQMTYGTDPKKPTSVELKTGETIYGVIYVNADVEVNDLWMNIFTDEGVVENIDLTVVNKEIKDNISAITDKAITALKPSETPYVKIQIDDNSFSETDVMSINNENDLEQLINWNKTKNRSYLAFLANDITLSNAMLDNLKAAKKANKNNQLIITNTGVHKLIIAKDVAADVFDYVNLNGEKFDIDHDGTQLIILSPSVEILGTATLDASALGLPNAADQSKLIVAKGATLNIASPKATNLLEVENYGTIAMAAGASASNINVDNTEKAKMTIAGTLTLAAASINHGTIEVKEGGKLKGNGIVNNKLIENAGEIWNIANADLKEVLVKANGTVNHFNSNGNDATIQLATLSTSVTVTTNTGHVLYEGADVDLNDATLAGVTDLVVSGFLHVEADGNAATVKAITVKEGTTAVIEGGYYQPNGTWKTDAQNLNVASSAKIYLSGTVTMNNLTNVVTADVNVLKGSLTIAKGIVAAIDNLTLGSLKDFEEFGATVTINKGAVLTIAGTVARDVNLVTVKPVINNNGTATAVTKTDITNNHITVNGNAIQ